MPEFIEPPADGPAPVAANRVAGESPPTTVDGGSDIDAVAYQVLMEAIDSSDSDLQQIMEETKAENETKQRLGRRLTEGDAAMGTAEPSSGA